MNLAFKDIRHSLGRFILTALGTGLLLMLVMGMGGIYRGLVQDATLLVDSVGADLWVVQRNTRGPFAELSRVPSDLEYRLRVVPGVRSARPFVYHTIQREHDGGPMRLTIQGLGWPEDRGDWLNVVAGRPLAQGHYEMIADETLGLPLWSRMRLGKETYTVVGVTRAMVSVNGDGMAFFSVRDAQAIQTDLAGEAVRIEREARHARAVRSDIGYTQPQVTERALGPSSAIPALLTPMVSAILVDVSDGTDEAAVRAAIGRWPDVTVHSTQDQRDLLILGTVDRARRQLGLFRALLVIVSAIIMALILYTLTLDKVHDIAMLKLMGARNRVIVGLILHQALLLGAIGYALAYFIGAFVFPRFPRRVIIVEQDLYMLAGIVLAISIGASLLGIWRAMRVQASEVLS